MDVILAAKRIACIAQNGKMMNRLIFLLFVIISYGCYPQPNYEGSAGFVSNSVQHEAVLPKHKVQCFRLTESIVMGLSDEQVYNLNTIIEMPVTFGSIRVPAGSRAKIYGRHKAYSILFGFEKILYVTFPEYNVNDVLTLRFDAKGGVYTLTDIYWGYPGARHIEFVWSAQSRGNYLLVEIK